MIPELNTRNTRNIVQSHFESIFINSQRRLKQMRTDIEALAKHKRAKKIFAGVRMFQKYDIYEIGFIGGIYKVRVAFNNNDPYQFYLFGFLDANSSYPIIVSTENFNKDSEFYKSIQGYGHLTPSEECSLRIHGLEALLVLREDLNPFTNNPL